MILWPSTCRGLVPESWLGGLLTRPSSNAQAGALSPARFPPRRVQFLGVYCSGFITHRKKERKALLRGPGADSEAVAAPAAAIFMMTLEVKRRRSRRV